MDDQKSKHFTEQHGFALQPRQSRLLLPKTVLDQLETEKRASDRAREGLDANLLGNGSEDADEQDEPLLRAITDQVAESRRVQEQKSETEGVTTRKRQSRPGRHLPVFDMDEIQTLNERAKTVDREARVRIKAELERAGRHRGMREIPAIKGLGSLMKEMSGRFPNFASAITGLTEDITLSGTAARNFRVAPTLLNGVPGIGKTHFSQVLAAKLGLPFLKISAGGLQHAAQLIGTASHWANSQTGQIFNVLATNDSAVAVVLLDEVDKIGTSQEYSVLPALLELLEPETSSRLKDESLGIHFDASRLIILMTSNNAGDIDTALLSRSNFHQVAEPSASQRQEIARSVFGKLCKQVGKGLTVDQTALARMAEEVTDLRVLIRVMRSAVVNAMLDKKKMVTPVYVSSVPKKMSIGFMGVQK